MYIYVNMYMSTNHILSFSHPKFRSRTKKLLCNSNPKSASNFPRPWAARRHKQAQKHEGLRFDMTLKSVESGRMTLKFQFSMLF